MRSISGGWCSRSHAGVLIGAPCSRPASPVRVHLGVEIASRISYPSNEDARAEDPRRVEARLQALHYSLAGHVRGPLVVGGAVEHRAVAWCQGFADRRHALVVL